MVSLTFYGGVNEIGGNKILLEDRGTKIFLDFGMGFGTRAKFFEEFLTPRTANGIGDFLATGLIPDIEGAYREDLLEHSGRKAETCDIDGLLLSHAHADHANYISFLHKDIPVFCGHTAKGILDAISEQSQRSIENEVIDFKMRPIFAKDRRNPPIKRIFSTFRTGDKLRIGGIDVEPVHVDHSVPGAYGFIIHTSEGPVVYTGDLRLHGMRSAMTEEFVEAAKASRPMAMITEGTRIGTPKTGESETNVHAESLNHVSTAKALAIGDFNFKDVDRFRTFYGIARETGRQLVISFKHACFLDNYHKDGSLGVPDSKGEGILLFKPKRLTGTYCDEDYTDAYIKKRLDYPNVITAEEIAKDPSKYLVVLNFWYFNSLVDLFPKGSQRGLYIHSLSEPFNEEMEISAGRMKNWLDHFHLRFVQSHCSGHINGHDLKEIIKTVGPRTLFPVHTEHPEMFKGFNGIDVTTVMENRVYDVSKNREKDKRRAPEPFK